MFNRHPRKAVTFDMDRADTIEDREHVDQLSGDETENEEDGEDMDEILRRKFGTTVISIPKRILLLHSKNRSNSLIVQ